MSETVILGNTFANVAELLHEAARGAPDAPAVTFNGATRTWAEVESRSRAAATLLARLGVGKGDRVALLGLNSDVCFETRRSRTGSRSRRSRARIETSSASETPVVSSSSSDGR